MSHIHIHVGLHKTATTYLQDLLVKNNDGLKSNGIFSFMPCNIREQKNTFREELKKAIPESKLIVISEENLIGFPDDCYNGKAFYPEAASRIKNFIEDFRHLGATQISLFLSLRSYFSFYPSLYSEYLRHHPFISFKDYLSQDVLHAHSWKELVSDLNMENINNLYIWEFEKFFSQREKIFSYLLKGQGHAIKQWDIKQNHASMRSVFSQKTIDILEEVNKANFLGKEESRKLSNKVDNILPKSKEHPAFQPFSEEERERLEQKYAQDISDLRKEYKFISS